MTNESARQIWETALGELQVQVNRTNYRTWFEKTIGLSYQDNQFTIGVPNTFIAEYLAQNQHSLIQKTLIGLTHSDVRVTFSVYTTDETPAGKKYSRKSLSEGNTSRLNPKYTFSSFVVSSNNRLAHAGALGVAENPGTVYNPLFIWGGTGLGKTHLLHAVGNMAAANGQGVLFVTGEQFTNEFVGAIRDRNTAEEFRRKYRSIDMLLVDDVQFIAGKEGTQECFYHTFNELHNANRQIVVTSNQPPRDIPQLEERLLSRFEWGLTADIQPPDFDTRLAILKVKAEQSGTNIELDVLELMAGLIQHNIRELEGNLNRVIAYARLLRTKLTPELAAKALESIAPEAPKVIQNGTPLLLQAVADEFQLSLADLKSRKRDKKTALGRMVAMYLIKEETDYSLARIGNELGGRNPSTVGHACEKIAAEVASAPHLQHMIQNIRQRMDKTPQA